MLIFLYFMLLSLCLFSGIFYLINKFDCINNNNNNNNNITTTNIMDPDEAKFMRTERKPGTLDVHPTMNALVLNYEIDVQILGAKENVLYSEKKALKKLIELPMLNSRTDCFALAKEVVYQCDLIHHSRISEVEQTIYYLKKRKLSHGNNAKDVAANLNNKQHSSINNIDEPKYNNLPNYIELLYEGMSEKIKGAHLIQLLARDPENLEALSRNETVISALGRVLREDWKRSIVLSTHLVFTFFCFSVYSRFHEVILKCKVGSICMEIIEYELRRYDKWKADLDGSHVPEDLPIVRKPCPNSASMSEIPPPRSRIPEPVRPKSGNFTDTNIRTNSNNITTVHNNNNNNITTIQMEGSVYDDLTNSTESIDDNNKRLSTAEKTKRFRTLVKKQEHLLRVAFYLLLNIAEDECIEEKMTKRNIVGLLIKALERDNDELLVLLVTFLKKLSIMQCNKDVMASLNIIEKLPKLLDSNNPDLVHLTLKLLFNLSFDNKLRVKMVKLGLLHKFFSLLSDDRHQEVVLKLLYHLSYADGGDDDDVVRGQFAQCVGLIIDMLLLNIGNEGDEVMVALCTNLAMNQINAQQMLKKNRLQSLMTRAFNYQNNMLMKMLRNLSEHASIRPNFIEFVGDIAKAVVESKETNFIVECVGILSNLNLPELDWAEIFKHFNMLKWVETIIRSNNADPELVLQIVVLLGTATADDGCAKLLCESNIISALIDLLKTHQEDDEIVLQIVFVFFSVLTHSNHINHLVENTEAPAYLIDLLQDNNKTIRQLCNTCLNIIAAYSKAWADRIKIEKFRHHNAQWLQMVDTQQLEPNDDDDDDDDDEDELPPYLNTEYLSTAVVPSLSDLNDAQESELITQKELDYDYFEKSEIFADFEIEAM